MSLDIYFHETAYSSSKGYPAIFEKNITHNLGPMAEAAGIYELLWHPDTINVTQVKKLIEPLTTAIADMEARPEYYKPFSAKNGWGTYEQFVPWLKELLTACNDYHNAYITTST